MSFWDYFTDTNSVKNKESYPSLKGKIEKLIPAQLKDDELIIITCFAGLLARVAYCDMEVSKAEHERIKTCLVDWTTLDVKLASIISDVAVKEMKHLAGIENHLYTKYLCEYLDIDQRIEILKPLFAVAASDDEVTSLESHEIEVISKGLHLSHRDFVSAQSMVADKLKALQDQRKSA